jgi:large repetitive protein
VILDQTTPSPENLQTPDIGAAASDTAATSDRYLELVVISPEGKITQRFRLKDEALNDLRGLISTLPDNHYKIYLCRTDSSVRRLVIDVYVRRGRVIDPADVSEGSRDRPPTDNAQPKQVQPLENNPQLERIPEQNPPGAMVRPNTPADQAAIEPGPPAVEDAAPPAEAGSSQRFRWAIPLAGVGLVAQRGSWAQELDEAFDRADERAWQRLRRAGRRLARS